MSLADDLTLEADIAEVDKRPKPTRLFSVARWAEALPAAYRDAHRDDDPEKSWSTFHRWIGDCLPTDVCTDTLDGWARLGAHQGASDAWGAANPAALVMLTMWPDPGKPGQYMPRLPPRDSPSIIHGDLWLAMYGLSLKIITRCRYGN